MQPDILPAMRGPGLGHCPDQGGRAWPSRGTAAGLVATWLCLLVLGLVFGPPLSDHETINAQVARQAIQSGDWLVPHFLDQPFLVKPPLMFWLIEAAAVGLPGTGPGGLPVTEVAARLPSVAATMAAAWVVYALGRSMFPRRIAWIAAFVYATSVGTLLYAFNAMTEMLLTACCTWAMAEFWWAARARATGPRHWHMLRFYVALALAMLAKAPMPLITVVAPLGAWWFLERPTRLLAFAGPRAAGYAAKAALRDVPRQTGRALLRLDWWWGIPVAIGPLLLWMYLVSRDQPHIWGLWDFEYFDRVEGRYPGSHGLRPWFYLVTLLGLALPWTLSVFEAVGAPFLRPYRRHGRGLTFAWYWVAVPLVLLSAMTFQKPYYILPATPGLALLLAPVLDRLFFGDQPISRVRARLAVAAIAVGLTAGFVVGWVIAWKKYPEMWHGRVTWESAILAATVVGACLAAGRLFLGGRRAASLGLIGGTTVLVFVLAWTTTAGLLVNIEAPRMLAAKLEENGVPPDAEVYWVNNRPDARVPFYFQRPIRYLFDPDRLAAIYANAEDKDDIRLDVGEEIRRRFAGRRPIYMVFQRKQFETLMSIFRPRCRELFYVDRGDVGPDRADWVVATNAGMGPEVQ